MKIEAESIVIDSSTGIPGDKHIKLVMGENANEVLRLSPEQARSLAKSLIQQVHRLEVASSMRQTQSEQTRAVHFGVKTGKAPQAPKLLGRFLPTLHPRDEETLDLSDFPVHNGSLVLR